MKLLIYCLLYVSFFSFVACNSTEKKKPQQHQSVTPESLGISSQAILSFVDAVEKERPDDMHSFILMRHGKVAAEGWWSPYRPDSPHMLFSLSKSFTSTAIGVAQAEGLLSIDDPVISFFPDETPDNPSDNLKAMRIRDLLKMNTGHNDDATGRMTQHEESWVKGFLSLPVEHKPGTHFVYNSGATFMLSAIVQKVTGETLLDYLTPRLFEPLDIENPTWDSNMNGINVGGWGLNIRTKDIASMGQLYLQNGEWEGKQLIPAEWVEEATSFQTSNGSNRESDWEQGYGYQFWLCRHDLYRGDGAFGQYCIVMPERDAVLAITSGTNDMQAIMNLAWDHLLPALKDEPLEENGEAYRALQERLGNLSLSTVTGEASSSTVDRVSGKTYQMESNDSGIKSLSFNLNSDQKSVVMATADSSFTLPIGDGTFEEGLYYLPQMGGQVVASSGAWIAEDTFRIRHYLYETPFYITNDIAFGENEIAVSSKRNVSFGNTEIPPLRGTLIQ